MDFLKGKGVVKERITAIPGNVKERASALKTDVIKADNTVFVPRGCWLGETWHLWRQRNLFGKIVLKR